MARATTIHAGAHRAPRAATTKKLDLRLQLRGEYTASAEPTFVDVAPAHYLAIAGRGAPDGEAFQTAMGALYGVAFTVKMARKRVGNDYVVPPLEGLWWADDVRRDFLSLPRDAWRWRLLLRVPEFVSAGEVRDAVVYLLDRGKPTAVTRVALYALFEGRCVQMLHVGSYADEPRSLARMREVVRASGLRVTGTHHEIYLSDPRRVAPERLRTILRLPVG